jgi:hypothetical protein
MVDDEARQVLYDLPHRRAVLFSPNLVPDEYPPLVKLGRLLSAAESVLTGSDGDEDMGLLLAPGSSLGGARPKASVRDRDGHFGDREVPEQGRRDQRGAMVLSILISNTDDHLSNHGFLHDGPKRWSLSPSYDLNPVPVDIKPRILDHDHQSGSGNGISRLGIGSGAYFACDPCG